MVTFIRDLSAPFYVGPQLTSTTTIPYLSINLRTWWTATRHTPVGLRARNIGESREIDRNERFSVEAVHRRAVTCLLQIRWKIYEESDLRERGPTRLTRDGGNGDDGARECRLRRKKRTRNTKFSSCRRWHEERRWNFYNDTFCARDYFRDVLAGIEHGGGARLCESIHESWAPEMNSRVDITYFRHFFFMPYSGSLMWKTCCGNLRMEVYYFRLLIDETTGERYVTCLQSRGKGVFHTRDNCILIFSNVFETMCCKRKSA